MNKKILFAIIAIISMLLFTGCTKQEQNLQNSFKQEYESVNGEVLRDDILYRTITIDENNPYQKVEIEDIVEKLDNKETFYLYVGDSLCPWCRSGLEKMIEVAKSNSIETIYYVDFWDDDHNEILRDLYEVQKDGEEYKIVKTQEAKEGYNILLSSVSDFAQDYTLTIDGEIYDVGVKRIFGGDHFYFENGVCKKYVSLRSYKLEKSDGELTDEVLKDQEEEFTNFFKKIEVNVCSDDSNC